MRRSVILAFLCAAALSACGKDGDGGAPRATAAVP